MASSLVLASIIGLLALSSSVVHAQIPANCQGKTGQELATCIKSAGVQPGATSGTFGASSGGQAQAAKAQTFQPMGVTGGSSGSSGSSTLTLGGSSSGSTDGGSFVLGGQSQGSTGLLTGTQPGSTGTGTLQGTFGSQTGGGLITGSQTGGGGMTTGGDNGNGDRGTFGGGDRGGRGSRCSTTLGNADCGGGKSDPIMTGFTGRSFNFFGDVGKTYVLVSTKNIQLAARLKLAQMWNHNGTNMDGIGMMYKTFKVLMELDGDTPKVYVQDKLLPEKKHVQKKAWRFEDGTAVEVEWDRFKPGIGNTVTVLTDVMKVMMWHTPKGIIDEGGKELEGYINFNITLLAAPENNVMSGIIGDTYERFTVGQEAFSPNSTYFLPEDDTWYGKGPVQDYEMANYWDTDFKMNTFGLNIDEIRSRSSLETDAVALVDLPAFASFTVLPERAPEAEQAAHAGTTVLRLRRRLLLA